MTYDIIALCRILEHYDNRFRIPILNAKRSKKVYFFSTKNKIIPHNVSDDFNSYSNPCFSL